jgi:hypothetical protein
VAAAASLLGGAVATTVTAHAAAAGCQVSYTISSQWAGGFGTNVAVTDLGDPVISWTLSGASSAGRRSPRRGTRPWFRAVPR